ncbi:uncharacterized protein [Coffea arabica]|uniref:Uncharacterized protein LOC113697294 n=1 Tax=Coffea arabica TaxID=13443 RepID=A0A6P6T2U2_COFAR|nr:uncharacterized protein LOC113697294 [Coffea arabica]XP_027072650.1 uncharacterized protein LOC113697294 [Coffea arabica]
MASTASLQTLFSSLGVKHPSAGASGTSLRRSTAAVGSKVWSLNAGVRENKKKGRSLAVVAAVGDVSSEGTTYLIAGAAAVALIGTAFPILFSRKDLCPECDGAGFVRQSGAALRANAARKDQAQIVCARCNGLGKLNQIDK